MGLLGTWDFCRDFFGVRDELFAKFGRHFDKFERFSEMLYWGVERTRTEKYLYEALVSDGGGSSLKLLQFIQLYGSTVCT